MPNYHRGPTTVIGALLLGANVGALQAQEFHAERLLTEYQQNPVGIDARAPRLSWQMHAARRGSAQSAYELRVATDSASLTRSPFWASGKVTTAASVLRPYGGPALKSGGRYYWQVRVWD